MSLLSKLVQKIAPVAATVGKFIPGIGTAVSLAGTAAMTYYGARAGGAVAQPGSGISGMPVGMGSPMTAGMFPGLSALPTVARAGGALVVRGARNVYRSAASYCRKHPGWCQTIGGIAAVEAMINNGQLPPIKARRGRGISATELRHFKRVARFTSKYCAPVRKAMKAPAMRRRSSCQ